jgi:hypothetical protein
MYTEEVVPLTSYFPYEQALAKYGFNVLGMSTCRD